MAGAGDVETKNPEADGHQTRAGEVLAALMQTQHEGRPRDDPTITKETGAPGRQSHHKDAENLSSDSRFEELTGLFVHEVDIATLHATGE